MRVLERGRWVRCVALDRPQLSFGTLYGPTKVPLAPDYGRVHQVVGYAFKAGSATLLLGYSWGASARPPVRRRCVNMAPSMAGWSGSPGLARPAVARAALGAPAVPFGVKALAFLRGLLPRRFHRTGNRDLVRL
jgi:hypothetical protein